MSDSGRQPGDDDVNVSLSFEEIRILQHIAAKHRREIESEKDKDIWRYPDRRLLLTTKIEEKLAAALEAFHEGRK